MRRFSVLLATALAAGACSAGDNNANARSRPHGTDDVRVYIVNLDDGDVVASPVRIVFGLSGRGVAPAGVDAPDTGHHHLIVDERLEGEEREYAIPADDNHIHFGGGQTETVLTLAPGDHTLQLVLGDLNHELLDPSVESEAITITVR